MQKFELIKNKYPALAVTADNIEFTIDTVREGTKKKIALASLTSEYRGMAETPATQLLEELYLAN